jgi:hypothetical protein
MKKVVEVVGVTLILLVGLVIVGFYLLFQPYQVPSIPDSVIADADKIFVEHMLAGEGAYRLRTGEVRSSYSQTEPNYMNHLSGGGNRLSINLNVNLENASGAYFIMRGQPLDIVRGPEYEYLLYGRELGVYYVPHKNSWDDTYKWLSSDFYLVRKNVTTATSEIVRKYEDVASASGSLQYKEGTGEIRVLICGVADEFVAVKDELEDNTALFRLSCSGSN